MSSKKNKPKQIQNIDTDSKFVRAAHFISRLPFSLDRVISMLLLLSKIRGRNRLSIECPMNGNQVLIKWLGSDKISMVSLDKNGSDVRKSLARYFNQPVKKMMSPGSWVEVKNMRFKAERVPMVFDGINIQFKPKK